MSLRVMAVLLVLGASFLPLGQAQVPIQSLDCAPVDVPYRAGPKWNHLTWGYESTQWEPNWLPGKITDDLFEVTAATAWNHGINNCGMFDESDINFHVGEGIAPGTGTANGHTEIYWAPNQGHPATAVPTSNDCDIILGREVFPTPTSNGGLPVLLSHVAMEMGRCAGLGTAGNAYQTMGMGLCVGTPVGAPMELRACGLTLGRGDILALNSLYPV